MNVALIGSVSSSWHALDALIRSGVEVTGVLGLDPAHGAEVSDYRDLGPRAQSAGIAFRYFHKVSDPEVRRFLEDHTPDLLWVIGLSQLIPDSILRIARHGCVGFHPTVLPQGRGRAPVAWTILLGAPAAVNLFFLTDEPDAGDLIIQRPVPVLPDDYSEDLIRRTNQVLAQAVADLAPRIRSGTLPRTPQDHSRATYYPKRTPADGRIEWNQSTDAIYRLIRAAGRPYPGAFARRADETITIWRARPAKAEELRAAATPSFENASAGTILAGSGDGPALVRTTDGGLWLTEAVVAGGGPGLQSRPASLKVGDVLS